MNALTIILLLYILMEALLGCKRGFFRSVLSLLVLILTMVFSCKLSPQVASYLSKETNLQKTIAERIEEYLQKDGEDSLDADMESRSWQKDFLENAGFPSYLSEVLGDNNNAEFFDALKVDSFYPYIATYLATVIINILAYFITFLVIWLILHMFASLLKGIGKIPVLRMLNRMGGMLFGIGKALLVVSLFLLLITMLSSTAFGQVLVAQMEESPILCAFYEHNPLIIFITDITEQIF